MKILLVEDDRIIAEGLEYALLDAGFEVILSYDVKSGLEKVTKNLVDIIILDINLPDGSGFEILNKAKGIPVVILSAIEDEGIIIKALEIGAFDYITKPFKVRELLARLKGIIRRENKDQLEIEPERISFFDLEIDLETLQVWKGDDELILTSLEYKLLMIFLNNRNQILTRERILEEIWDNQGKYINDNTLSVHVKRLREKIEEDAKNPKIILTIRGFGYRVGRDV